MPLIILLALIAVPVVELFVFIEIGAEIGAGPVIAATFATAFIGLAIARNQGIGVMRQMQAQINEGRPPVEGLVHGFFLLLAGIALAIPGLVTDLLGAVLLIPLARIRLGRSILSRFADRAKQTDGGVTIIEADYTVDTTGPADAPEKRLPPGR